MAEKVTTIDYKELEEFHKRKLDLQMQKTLEDRAERIERVNKLQHTVLSCLVNKDYDRALGSLDAYIEQRTNYPRFKWRVRVYSEHCRSLIHAFKMKRNFPGLAQLPLTRQQEILKKVVEHFNELKIYLRRIEIMEKEIILDDIRSTVWFLRSVMASGVILFALFMFVDIKPLWRDAYSWLDMNVANLLNLLLG